MLSLFGNVFPKLFLLSQCVFILVGMQVFKHGAERWFRQFSNFIERLLDARQLFVLPFPKHRVRDQPLVRQLVLESCNRAAMVTPPLDFVLGPLSRTIRSRMVSYPICHLLHKNWCFFLENHFPCFLSRLLHCKHIISIHAQGWYVQTDTPRRHSIPIVLVSRGSGNCIRIISDCEESV